MMDAILNFLYEHFGKKLPAWVLGSILILGISGWGIYNYIQNRDYYKVKILIRTQSNSEIPFDSIRLCLDDFGILFYDNLFRKVEIKKTNKKAKTYVGYCIIDKEQMPAINSKPFYFILKSDIFEFVGSPYNIGGKDFKKEVLEIRILRKGDTISSFTTKVKIDGKKTNTPLDSISIVTKEGRIYYADTIDQSSGVAFFKNMPMFEHKIEFRFLISKSNNYFTADTLANHILDTAMTFTVTPRYFTQTVRVQLPNGNNVKNAGTLKLIIDNQEKESRSITSSGDINFSHFDRQYRKVKFRLTSDNYVLKEPEKEYSLNENILINLCPKPSSCPNNNSIVLNGNIGGKNIAKVVNCSCTTTFENIRPSECDNCNRLGPPRGVNNEPDIANRPKGKNVWIPGHWKLLNQTCIWKSGEWSKSPYGYTTKIQNSNNRGFLWIEGYYKLENNGLKSWVPGDWHPLRADERDMMPQPVYSTTSLYTPMPFNGDRKYWIPGKWISSGETCGWRKGRWSQSPIPHSQYTSPHKSFTKYVSPNKYQKWKPIFSNSADAIIVDSHPGTSSQTGHTVSGGQWVNVMYNDNMSLLFPPVNVSNTIVPSMNNSLVNANRYWKPGKWVTTVFPNGPKWENGRWVTPNVPAL